jgi:hypothetical protein
VRNSFDVKLHIPVWSIGRSYVHQKEDQNCSVKGSRTYLLNITVCGKGMSSETKAEMELAKTRSKKRKFESFRRKESGKF